MTTKSTRYRTIQKLIDNSKLTEEGCWLFTGAQWRNGYATINYRGKQWGAHRLMCYLVDRPRWNPDLEVMHLCPKITRETRACVNPAHLKQGTRSENLGHISQTSKRSTPTDMLTELRLQEGLTRSELASRLNRSVNYIVKAEQLTFPTLPPAFSDYYSRALDTDADILRDAYRDAQRRTREEWLDTWVPTNTRDTFRRRWVYRNQDPNEVENPIHPTEYALSKGLCIPAATVYRSEKDGSINAAIKEALSDLVDFCLSGRYQAKYGYDDEAMDVVTRVVRLKQEMERSE